LDLEAYLKEKKAVVDSALKQYLAPESFLFEAMAYSTIDGGKRLRPIMAIATYEACGGRDSQTILPIACGLEMVHVYSLIHDDLPAMDNDDYRRGKLTNHKVYGEAMAILAGDGLYAYAFEMFTRGPGNRAAQLRVVEEMAEVTGPRGIVYGQALDIRPDKNHDPKTLRLIHRNKTAKFFAAAIKCGAIMAGADEDRIARLSRAGLCLGMLFQITDDILDVIGDKKTIGKATHKDDVQNKLTYPRVYGLAGARFRARAYADLVQRAVSGPDGRFEFLSRLTDYLRDRNF
jgi:geranylgeranyl diphosphate synthase type II